MEKLQMLYEAIGTLGFPICMVVYFIWDKTKITNQMTQAIENNNTILARLLERLGEYSLADDVGNNE